MLVAMLLGYLLLLLLVSLAVARRRGDRGARAFFVADGKLSSLVTACSLTATSVGGSSTVLSAALIYRHGLAGIWFDLAGAIGFFALGALLARRVRESGVCSIAELAGRRYGETVRRAVAVLVVVAELGWLALLAKATAALLAPAVSVREWQLIALTLAVVVLYTTVGGQLLVSYTDLAQIAVMVVGLAVVAPLFVFRVAQPGELAALRWSFPVSDGFGPARIGAFLVLAGLPHMVGSDIYAKVLSARDGRTAARGAMLAAAMKLLFAAAVAVVALWGAHRLPQLDRPDALLGTVVHQLLPPAVAACLLVALAATMMSSADQVLLSAVTMIAHDLWKGAPAAARHLAAVGAGGLAFVVASAFPTVIDLMKVAYTVFSAGLALPVLLAAFPSLALPRRGVLAAMVVGAAVGTALHVGRLAGGYQLSPVIWGVAANALVLGLATLARRR